MRSSAAASTSPRRNRHDEILDAAIDLFRRKGYARTSIQEIADAVGLKKASLFHYFGSKEDILFRICDDSHRAAEGLVDRAEETAADPIERLREFVRLYMAYYLANIERVTVYQRERRYLKGSRWNAIVEQRRVYGRYVSTLLSEGKTLGLVDPRVSERFVNYFIFGAINSVTDWYRRDGAASSDEIAERYAEMACVVALMKVSDTEGSR